MGKMTLKLYVVLFLGLFSMGAKCQEVALKSNLLYDAFATLNAGVETGLADRWTLDVSANYNGWTSRMEHIIFIFFFHIFCARYSQLLTMTENPPI